MRKLGGRTNGQGWDFGRRKRLPEGSFPPIEGLRPALDTLMSCPYHLKGAVRTRKVLPGGSEVPRQVGLSAGVGWACSVRQRPWRWAASGWRVWLLSVEVLDLDRPLSGLLDGCFGHQQEGVAPAPLLLGLLGYSPCLTVSVLPRLVGQGVALTR